MGDDLVTYVTKLSPPSAQPVLPRAVVIRRSGHHRPVADGDFAVFRVSAHGVFDVTDASIA